MMAEMEMARKSRSPQNIPKPPPPASESGSERTEVDRHSFFTAPKLNLYTTPSGASYPTCTVSNSMRFNNCTIWLSWWAEVAGSGSRRSLGLILGRVLICRRDVVLPTACNFLLTAARLSVLLIISFHRDRA